MKIVVDISKEHLKTLRQLSGLGYYHEVIAKGQPLSEVLDKMERTSEKAETKAYFDGQAYGWEEGRKDLCDKISAEINEELKDAVDGSERLGMYSALRIIEKYKKEEINE